MAIGISRTQEGSFLGGKVDGRLAAPSMVTGAALFVAGAALTVLFAWLFRSKQPRDADAEPMTEDDAHASRMLAAGAIAGALFLVLVARDLVIKPENADQPGRSACFSSSLTTTGVPGPIRSTSPPRWRASQPSRSWFRWR